MCHSCGSRNPDNMASYFLDCRFRGNTPLRRPLDGRGRGEVLHSAKVLQNSDSDARGGFVGPWRMVAPWYGNSNFYERTFRWIRLRFVVRL